MEAAAGEALEDVVGELRLGKFPCDEAKGIERRKLRKIAGDSEGCIFEIRSEAEN